MNKDAQPSPESVPTTQELAEKMTKEKVKNRFAHEICTPPNKHQAVLAHTTQVFIDTSYEWLCKSLPPNWREYAIRMLYLKIEQDYLDPYWQERLVKQKNVWREI